MREPNSQSEGFFNREGVQICGFLKANRTRCQRVGLCPYHRHTTKSTLPAPRTSQRKGDSDRKRSVRRLWTEVEKQQLEKAIAKHGYGNWKAMMPEIPSRSYAQIESHAIRIYGHLRRRKQSQDTLSFSSIQQSVFKQSPDLDDSLKDSSGASVSYRQMLAHIHAECLEHSKKIDILSPTSSVVKNYTSTSGISEDDFLNTSLRFTEVSTVRWEPISKNKVRDY